MVVGAKVCDLTEDLLWFVCGLYVGILTSSLTPPASPVSPSTLCGADLCLSFRFNLLES